MCRRTVGAPLFGGEIRWLDFVKGGEGEEEGYLVYATAEKVLFQKPYIKSYRSSFQVTESYTLDNRPNRPPTRRQPSQIHRSNLPPRSNILLNSHAHQHPPPLPLHNRHNPPLHPFPPPPPYPNRSIRYRHRPLPRPPPPPLCHRPPRRIPPRNGRLLLLCPTSLTRRRRHSYPQNRRNRTVG